MTTVRCTEQVLVGVRRDGSAINAACGSWQGGEKVFCDEHQHRYQALYPQGWRGYPGDTCRHGHYVGGCGADLMCPACEQHA